MRQIFRTTCLTACAALPLLLAGCATPPAADDPDAVAEFKETNDPFEPANRVSYRLNTTLDTYAIKPVAQGYIYAVPKPARDTVHNVLNNLGAPTVFVNDVAEGNARRAAVTLWRFTVNSLFGVGGAFDVAGDVGVPGHDANFATTLGVWGVPEGPFIEMIFLGPSNPRGLAGFAGDEAADPFMWAPSGHGLKTLDDAEFGLNVIDTRSSMMADLDKIQKSALDPYATIRSLYRQNAQSAIDAARRDDIK
jgi:phospholipid-binding lipoprotein MlaA